MNRMQAALEQERKDVEEQRNKLYRKLEALQAQGFEIGTNMTVVRMLLVLVRGDQSLS